MRRTLPRNTSCFRSKKPQQARSPREFLRATIIQSQFRCCPKSSSFFSSWTTLTFSKMSKPYSGRLCARIAVCWGYDFWHHFCFHSWLCHSSHRLNLDLEKLLVSPYQCFYVNRSLECWQWRCTIYTILWLIWSIHIIYKSIDIKKLWYFAWVILYALVL